MRTGSNPWRTIVVAALLLHAFALQAQTDSVRYTGTAFDRYWTKPLIVPKLGLGYQDRAFVEVGIQWHTIYKHPLTLVSKGPYLTVDLFVRNSNTTVGPKLGYEFTAGLIGGAIDMTYFIDHNYNDDNENRRSWVLTPKIGISILGFADLFYGYAIPVSEERIDTISRNRFSLVFNINTYYFDLKDAPRRRVK